MAETKVMDRSRRFTLTSEALREGELAQAYALVNLCHDRVSLEHWCDHVATTARPSRKVWSAVRDPKGYIHGVFCYRIEHDLAAGRALLLCELLTAGPASRATLAEIESSLGRLAADLDCQSVMVPLRPEKASPTVDQVREIFVPRGYVEHGAFLYRTLG